MNFDLNKFYKTRSGRKVRLYSIENNGSYPVHGAIEFSPEEWLVERWTNNGKYINCYDYVDEDHDIVGEWEEPKQKKKLLGYRNILSGVLLRADEKKMCEIGEAASFYERQPDLDVEEN